MKKKSGTSQKRVTKFLGEVGKGEEVLMEMMLTLVQALEERDEYTRGHSERVALLSVAMGRELCLDDKRLATLRRGALLHDIGKIGIRDELLYKPGSFTPEERARMNQHPEKGHFIVLNSHLMWDLIPVIRNHHENFDGSGYPDGFKGEGIPLEARVVSLADYFDALATSRPYKQPFTKEKAVEFVVSMSGKKFDPAVVEAFLKVVDKFYAESIQNFKPPADMPVFVSTTEQTFEIESEPRHLGSLREQLQHFLEQTGLAPKTQEEIQVALGEACTNAIRHSYLNEPGKKIRVTAQNIEDKVLFKIRDFGKKIELDKLQPPELPPTRPGGLGIYFMKTIMDELEYNTSHAEGNELILVKYKKRRPS